MKSVSAKGFFLSKAKERGFSVFGIELNKRTVGIFRSLVGNTVKDVDIFDARFQDEMFDVIYMRDVIEHVADPLPFFREVKKDLETWVGYVH